MIFKKNILFSSICTLAGLIIALVLCSWNPYDPTWLYAGALHDPIKNILGWFGANFAALLIFLWGMSAYLLIPFLGYLALFFFQKHTIIEEYDKIGAWVLLIITGSITCAIYHAAVFPPFSAGGLIGQFFASWLTTYCDLFLVKVLLGTSTFISISLISRFSFMYIAEYSIRVFCFIFNKERVLLPLANTLSRSILFITRYIHQKLGVCVTFLLSLFNGSFLDKNDNTIVSFEFDEVLQEVLQETTNDTFWFPEQASIIHNDTQDEVSQITTKENTPMLYGTSIRQKEKKVTQQPKRTYTLPHARLFSKSSEKLVSDEEQRAEERLAHVLEEKLARFGIAGKVIAIKSGPVITLFEYQPDIDAKISKIIALEDDLALALQAVSIRIIAPIPGRSVVGFEVAKQRRRNVLFSTIVHAGEFQSFSGKLPLVFGQDTVGNNVVVDLVTMPHLLVAGSTGSGKSVALNTMLMSLLYCKTPDELKLILIDPKRLEFASYADIGHLLFPIVTEPKEAAPVLQWVVQTMEERYKKMAECGVRNIFDYENVCKQNKELEQMPYLVVIIDELSDLMMTAGKEIEGLIARIAQMARAAGIHMILATQRPSVDVITGLIKVNFPSRISFRVTSKVDSRTILDCVGAEKLLGKGDMLFLDSSSSALRRVHGAYVSDVEITNLVAYIRAQQKPNYLDIKPLVEAQKSTLLEGDDNLYQEIVIFIKTVDEISISLLQRRFRIGYNRSARIIEMLETEGHILPSDGSKMRKVVH